jgi:hypothetical protein
MLTVIFVYRVKTTANYQQVLISDYSLLWLFMYIYVTYLLYVDYLYIHMVL